MAANRDYALIRLLPLGLIIVTLLKRTRKDPARQGRPRNRAHTEVLPSNFTSAAARKHIARKEKYLQSGHHLSLKHEENKMMSKIMRKRRKIGVPRLRDSACSNGFASR